METNIDSSLTNIETNNNSIHSIDDEVLVKCVKANPILYDKSRKDYKNSEMKKEVWKIIATNFDGVSGEDLEDRFLQLRNQLTKKLREMRQKPPSGSGGGVKIVKWQLMGAMSFLIPHINPRKTRGSLSQTTQSIQFMQSKESPLVSSLASVPALSSSATIASSSLPPLCTKAVSSPPLSYTSSDISYSETSSSLLSNEPMSNMWESANDSVIINVEDESCSTADDINVSESLVKKKRKVTPPPDTFHSSKKKKLNNDIEVMLMQSSTAFQEAAKAVSSLIPTATETKERKNPYARAITAALEKVSVEKTLDCFIAIMNTIKEYS